MPRNGNTTARGYGTAHQQLRRQIARIVDAGQAHCVRCGKPIIPGTPWDLGHDDNDRSRYQGPEHRGCNRSAGARNRQRRTQQRTSVRW